MEAKTFEVRDAATFIPILAVRLNPANEKDRYLLARAGFGRTPQSQGEYVQLIRINGGSGESSCDSNIWGNRTMRQAHLHIIANWSSLESGDVVDVEFILGETTTLKCSESEETI